MDGLALEDLVPFWKAEMSYDLTSIIIINYNTKALTDELIKSIQVHCAVGDYQIVLVDNGSLDGSAKYFQSRYPEYIHISNRHNAGFAKAANQAAKASKGEYLWFVNSDCRLGSRIIPVLKDALKTMTFQLRCCDRPYLLKKSETKKQATVYSKVLSIDILIQKKLTKRDKDSPLQLHSDLSSRQRRHQPITAW